MTYPAAAPDVPVSANSETLNTLGGAASQGHVTQHNKVRTAILEIGTFLGITGGHKVPVKLDQAILATTFGSISFQNIPPGYRSLRFQFLLRTNAGSASYLKTTFNNDTGATQYAYQAITGVNTTVAAFRSTGDANIYTAELMRTADTANIFSGGVIDIYDYAATDKNKMLFSTNGWPNAGVYCVAGSWKSNAGITRVDFTPSVGSFIAGSSITLWGMPT